MDPSPGLAALQVHCLAFQLPSPSRFQKNPSPPVEVNPDPPAPFTLWVSRFTTTSVTLRGSPLCFPSTSCFIRKNGFNTKNWWTGEASPHVAPSLGFSPPPRFVISPLRAGPSSGFPTLSWNDESVWNLSASCFLLTKFGGKQKTMKCRLTRVAPPLVLSPGSVLPRWSRWRYFVNLTSSLWRFSDTCFTHTCATKWNVLFRDWGVTFQIDPCIERQLPHNFLS